MSINPSAYEFPGQGEYRLLSEWLEMWPSPEVQYIDNKNQVISSAKKLKTKKGVSLGSASRLNIVPTSISTASVQLQIFPRSITELKVK